MTAYVYILECADKSLYVGSTRNIENRAEQHNTGRGSRYTSKRTPVRLAWYQEYENIGEAYALEKRIQKWSRAKRIALIEGRYGDLPALARKKPKPPSRSDDLGAPPPVVE
ncbi:GIY-YIG nuclease family protein [Gordonia sp. CPCC 205515]|uniref:GIY-YIG nuclease family protein n=1 Tax=Gordonia sp. CPCC 205515 TaxID=3140791 RepID=UPI003AF36296